MNIKQKLLSEFNSKGYWEGELSSSALSTATATFAIYLTEGKENLDNVKAGLNWLANNVNDDGGWGDTNESKSNLSTTLLVWSAFSISDKMGLGYRKIIRKAEKWLATNIREKNDNNREEISPSEIANSVLEYYGNDRTFSVPILFMCAIAGRLDEADEKFNIQYGTENKTNDSKQKKKSKHSKSWQYVPQLPFELAIFPHSFFRLIKLPVVSYALPALITMGLARHKNKPSRFLPLRIFRDMATNKVLQILTLIQPWNGGFLEAIPLTSFVLMGLISAKFPDISVAAKCLDFLLKSQREDGSWPIDTNLATWLTTLAVKALDNEDFNSEQKNLIRKWLLDQQFKEKHQYTDAIPGGWGWTDLPGATPDADDTAGALLALKKLDDNSSEIRDAAIKGVKWLVNLQNNDGGIPTFCRGWGKLPFDRSCPDITAHALRAFLAWEKIQDPDFLKVLKRVEENCLLYLEKNQMEDGSWIPIWFGNQNMPDMSNPIYGTSQVLIGLSAFSDNDRNINIIKKLFDKGVEYLRKSQIEKLSLEEAALMAKALSFSRKAEDVSLVSNIQQKLLKEKEFKPSPIGLYFASLWYSEKLYPLIFVLDALE